MIGLDTNVLIRILVDDSSATEQCDKARTLLLKYEKIFICTIVMVEMVWVLRRAYKIEKNTILDILHKLLFQEKLIFEDKLLIQKSLDTYRTENFEFSDALILASHQARQCALYTFDKKLGQYPSVTEIS